MLFLMLTIRMPVSLAAIDARLMNSWASSLNNFTFARVMKEGAHILCFDWDTKESPIGPEMSIRVSSSDMEKTLTDAGLTVLKYMTPTEYLYIFVAKK